MVFDALNIACPGRYTGDIHDQPVYGDTDSIVVTLAQANRLVQAGMVQNKNGYFTDELAGDGSHWFIPKRLADSMPSEVKSLSIPK